MQLCTSLLLSLLPAASPFAPTSALSSFAQKDRFASPHTSRLSSSAPSDTGSDDFVAPSGSAVDQLESYKADLVSMCLASSTLKFQKSCTLVVFFQASAYWSLIYQNTLLIWDVLSLVSLGN